MHAMGGVPKPDNPSARKAEVELYECFEEVNGFANALSEATWCGVVARQALNEKAVGHVGKGVYYYFADTISSLKNVPIFVVHVETMERDLACLFSKLGLSRHFKMPPKDINSEYERRNRTHVDDAGLRKLTRALANDYWMSALLESHSRCPGGHGAGT